MAALGLGYEELAKINPAIIYVSISPFGQDGPKALYADADLILMAASGPLVLTGDDDRPPVRLSVPQAFLHACADATVAALAAHHERVRSGSGQHIDVAAQASVAMATQSYVLAAPLNSPEAQRMSGGVKFAGVEIPLVWPAKDGYIAFTFLFGTALGVFTRKFMEYICELGYCDEATRDKDWIAYGELVFSGKEPLSEFERIKKLTKAELLGLAVERGFLMTPITTTEEVVKSPQLESRDYWQTVEHPESGRSIVYPGPFAKFSATPIRYRRRAPLVGEHNREVLGEIGVGGPELDRLAGEGVV
jgi:crotonobetainyl-CoA:carnitine CoA-transferase CaiB-like acyl-CoA transferase